MKQILLGFLLVALLPIIIPCAFIYALFSALYIIGGILEDAWTN